MAALARRSLLHISSRWRRSLGACALLLVAAPAPARPTRPRFEPTDLEIEDAGWTEFDLQTGVAHGDGSGGNRLLSDFELDVGLTPAVELDLDGAFSLDRFDTGSRKIAGEALWPAMKLGIGGTAPDPSAPTAAFGMQLGPRLPTIGAEGVGYAALGLFGLGYQRVHTVLNAGGVVDPGTSVAHGHPRSLVAGLDVDVDLDAAGAVSLLTELAAARYLSNDPDELSATLGAAWDVGPHLELSAIVLAGFVPGADRLAVLLGVSPKAALF